MNNFSDVLSIYQLAKKELSETLSSCEMMDAGCMYSVVNNLNLKPPLSTACEFYMVIETHGSREEHDNEKMEGFVEKAVSSGIVKDGTYTSDPARMNVSIVLIKFIYFFLRDF